MKLYDEGGRPALWYIRATITFEVLVVSALMACALITNDTTPAICAILFIYLSGIWTIALLVRRNAPAPAVAVRETHTTLRDPTTSHRATEPGGGPAMGIQALRRLCWRHRLLLIGADLLAGSWSVETGGDPTGRERRAVLQRALECSQCRILNAHVPDWSWSLPSAGVDPGEPPTHTRPGHSKGWVIVGLAVLAGAVALTANTVVHSRTAPAAAARTHGQVQHTTWQTRNVVVPKLKAGDCLPHGIPWRSVARVKVGSCHQPHREEVYAVFDLEPGHYPGQKSVDRRGDADCKKRFKAYVGIGYGSSEMDYYSMTPGIRYLSAQYRTVVCVVVDVHRDTASLKGARR